MEEERIHDEDMTSLVEGANHTSDKCVGEIHFGDRSHRASKGVEQWEGAASGGRYQDKIDTIILCQYNPLR